MTRNKGDFKKRYVRMFQKLQKMMLKMPKDDRIVDQEVAEATNDGMFILTKDGRLWKKDKKGRRLCIPREWGQYITHSRHNNNHFGVNRSYAFISDRFLWKMMKKDVKDVVSGCFVCQKRKIPRLAKGILHTVKAERK